MWTHYSRMEKNREDTREAMLSLHLLIEEVEWYTEKYPHFGTDVPAWTGKLPGGTGR